MKILLPKLQDDFYSKNGRAEKYLSFNAKFALALRGLGAKKADLLNLDPNKIIKKYGLKGFVFGNYVTQEERYFFLLKISKQLELLSKIKGSNKLADNDLVIAFGSQGISFANAHFNPSLMLINLNRGRKKNWKDELKGESSFIHEYAHYLDFKKGRSSLNHDFNFQCQSKHNNNPFHGLIKKLINDEDYWWFIKDSKYLRSDVEVFARAFESTISFIVEKKKMKGYRNYVTTYMSPKYPTSEMIEKYEMQKFAVKILRTQFKPTPKIQTRL